MDDASGLNDRYAEQLAPLRNALTDRAKQDAEQRLAEARERADRIRQDAEAAAAERLAKAAAEGEAGAERESAHRRVEARRAARRRVLSAQKAAWDALIPAARAELDKRRDSQEYAALQERLAAEATARLGEGATVQRDPEGRGGVIAYADQRSLDLTLNTLLRRCLDRAGREVEGLWK